MSRPCSWGSTASASIRTRRRGYDGALPDIQTLAMEFAHLIAQARRTLQSLDAGPLEEFTLRAETLTLVVRVLTQEYFLACAVLPSGNLGQGPIPDANDRAGAARRPVTVDSVTRGKDPLAHEQEGSEGEVFASRCVPAAPARQGALERRGPASTSNRCASWRASPPSSTCPRSRSTAAVTCACAAAAAARSRPRPRCRARGRSR